MTDSTTPIAHPRNQAASFWLPCAWGALLVLMVAVVYWPTLGNAYIWDDAAHLEDNAALTSPDGLWEMWFQVGAIPQYYPLVHTTFWVEYRLWQLDPLGYHAVNMALHAVSALLIWRLLARLAVPGAWLAAAIFAVHPVNVESVAWVAERKNVLSCALALASVWAYLKFSPPELSDAAHPPTSISGAPWYWLLAFALYVAALLSKTVTASVPAVLLVIAWWKRGRLKWRDVFPLVPFFAVGVALAGVTVWMETTFVGASGQEWDQPPLARVLIAGRALWFYAGKLFWPHPLIFFYPRWTIDTSAWWQYLFPAAALVVVAGLWFARGKIGRGALAAVLIFAGVLVPALGFFNVYPFRYSYVADHFQYHASIALIALAAAAGTLAAARLPREAPWIGPAIAAAVLLPLGAVAHWQTYIYRDQVSLYEDIIERNPTNWAARNNLGAIYKSRGDFERAAPHFGQSIALNPRNFDALYNYAMLLAHSGDLKRAIEMMRRAIEVEPKSGPAEHELGIMFYNSQESELAIVHLRNAVRLEPNNDRWQVDLGVVFLKTSELGSAEKHFRQAIALNPKNADAHNYLGGVFGQRGDADAAIEEFQAALRIDAKHPTALNNLQAARDAKRKRQQP